MAPFIDVAAAHPGLTFDAQQRHARRDKQNDLGASDKPGAHGRATLPKFEFTTFLRRKFDNEISFASHASPLRKK